MSASHPLDRHRKGRSCHGFIGQLVASGVHSPDRVRIRELAGLDPSLNGLAPTHRRILRGDLEMAGAQYLRHFAPLEDWSFVGAEISVGTAIADLVWRASDGAIWIDEIKSGIAPLGSRDRLEQQVERLVTGGERIFGDALAGVRVCTLKVPAAAWVATNPNRGGVGR